MNKYIIIGGGPSAKEYAQDALLSNPLAKVITCNGGLAVYDAPDAYLITDDWAIEQYADDYKLARTNGVEIITRPETAEAVGAPCTFIDYDLMNATNYGHGYIAHGRSSGVICVQIALSRGATSIHLLGFDGFNPDEMKYEKVDGDKVIQRDRYGLNEAMSTVLGKIIAHRTDVEFIWHGGSRSRLCFPEWRVERV